IVLFNGSSVAVVEVKYRIHPNDLERLINRKVEHFRMLFPRYAKHKLYLGIAGMSFDENVTEQAAAAGVAVLERKDKEVESTAANLKAY
ncbi:MAG: hypothetical protein LBN39_02375, partial [Planctomycetaceae bacterium]|nr:hypothetical protein [Planctomycetaceae bacterium]